jgi:hypothetical protein
MTDMIYTPSSGTDIMARFRKYGYVPPSELPEYQAKWDYYQSLPLRKENPTEVGLNGGSHLKETSHFTRESS